MASMAQEIIGGFNAFIADQKATPGKATLTLVQFDNEIDRLASFKPIAEVENLTDKTYVPRGMTKLYDAIGLTVKTVKEEIAKAADKPDRVLVAILTDGEENSSQEYTTETIRKLLQDQQAEKWEFTFIGANQDAVLSGRGIGLAKAAANLTYAATPDGATKMFASLSKATSAFRCSTAVNASFAYSQADRDDQHLDPQSAYASSSKAVFREHGSLAGKLGGPARSASLSPLQRSKIARQGAQARWSRASV